MLIGIQKNLNIMLDLLSTLPRRLILIDNLRDTSFYRATGHFTECPSGGAVSHFELWRLSIYKSTNYYCDSFYDNVDNNINVELS